ncbi:Amino Acid-Polyamine-Organocation (APC) Family [Achlya hypogyna]|uniref:Amino Acid-Polyamine-Organocation (APC) Family n=1 Tax=Achlya hypogyna TaxID=1202772 RepID=A0A1V9Y941_ACHHY|nr:Amino Acid-Polyamine-Organocation (APC) Family [Achlya hypogyna]
MGGQLYGWNAALATGFVPFVASQLCTSAAYVIYISSIAEVSCKVPFAGVSYSLTRITLGYFTGFLVGFLELLEYVASASVSVGYVGEFLTTTFDWDPRFQPLIWFVFYAVFVALFQLPGRIYWRFMVVFALLCALPTPLIIVAGFMAGDLRANAAFNATSGSPVWATGTLETAYFAWLPYTTWAFAGVESLTLVTGAVVEPKKTMPRGMLLAVWSLCVSNIALLFVVPSLPPGIAACVDDVFPLNNGFSLLGISDSMGQWLIFPAQVGMAAGFFLPYGHLTQSLANSNMLPPMLGLKNQRTTLKPMAAASVFGFCLCTVGYFSPEFKQAEQNLFILAGTFCYGAQLAGFVMLRTTYRCDSTGYVSPYGIPGAVFAGAVFVMMAISIAGGFQNDGGVAVSAMVVFVGVLCAFYHLVCKNTQTLSKDEYATVFKFSIIKFNASRSRKSHSHSHRFLTAVVGRLAAAISGLHVTSKLRSSTVKHTAVVPMTH